MKKIFIFVLFLLGIVMQASCNNGSNNGDDNKEVIPDSINDNYRVMYEIMTGSFSDSDGDGIGDLKGIINKLDYLNDGNINNDESLGVQGLWLTPIFSSPTYHKYDVTNYYKIDEDFGTMDDLKTLIEEAHKRNVIIILDLVINHTASNNQWFRKFTEAHKNNDTTSEYYDYYSWCIPSEKPAGRTFSTISGTTHMYEANFTGDMPELNFDNPKVREEVVNIAKYYLDMGVDGFRFDAAKYIYYGDNNKNVEFWDWYMAELRKIKSDVYCVGEVWSSDIETIPYHSSLNCFNFQMGQAEGRIKDAVALGDVNVYASYIENYIQQIKAQNSNAMLMSFISNHDMDRSAGYFTLGSKRMHMAANLYILCYGSPFIYYGEEIGMKGTRGGANTDANRRLAMLWGDGNTIKDPVGSTYDSSKQTNGTVASQEKNKDSLLNYYKKLIKFRNKYPAIGRGNYTALKISGSKAGGFKIEYDGKTYYLIHNTLDRDVDVSLDLIDSKTFVLLDYIGQGSAFLDYDKVTIGPQTSILLGIK